MRSSGGLRLGPAYGATTVFPSTAPRGDERSEPERAFNRDGGRIPGNLKGGGAARCQTAMVDRALAGWDGTGIRPSQRSLSRR